jgi:WhiB family redox-sensing transcriptional regulator
MPEPLCMAHYQKLRRVGLGEQPPMYPPPPGEWISRGACKGMNPDLFFPERGVDVRAAKAVCARCDVADECAQYALDNTIRSGIWGGLSERERREIRSRRHRGVS